MSKIIDVRDKKASRLAVTLGVLAIVIVLFVLSLAIVPAGSTGVITTFGQVADYTYSEGFHLKIPIAQELVVVSNKIEVYEADSSAVSKDLQTVNSKIAVNFRVRADSSASIYQNIGPDYKTVILMPAVQESMKAVSAKYTAEELISERNRVGEEIKEQLTAKVADYGIQVEKFNIVNFEFTAEFNNAIEQKQVAEQNKLRAETEKEQKKIEAEAEAQKVKIAAEAKAEAIKTEAEAQAEANQKLSESLSQRLVDYQTIEKWNGELPKVASDANPLIALDLEKDNAEGEAAAE